MYTNSKNEVHDKFQKGLLRNMVEVMGILEANKPFNPQGYTSATTAYWTRGDHKKSDYGVMALCEVAVGESYVPDTDRNYTKSYLEKEDFKVCGQKEKRQGCMEVA